VQLELPFAVAPAAAPTGTLRYIQLGGAYIAVQTGARVLPVAHNAGLLWPRHSFLKYPGKVTVVIGEPIDSAGQTPEQLMRKVEDWIEGQVEILVRAEREKNAA
jgi:1-acyl-sn-glycerol-3-phosphate acyltransferase